MSTPIFNLIKTGQLLLLGFCLLAVSACSDMPLVARLGSSTVEGAGSGPSRVFRTAQGVELNAPRRYCVDGKESKTGPDGSFVLMAGCQTLGVGTALSPSTDAVLTATIAPRSKSVDFRGAEAELVGTLRAQSSELRETIVSVSQASAGRVVLTVREAVGLGSLSWRGFVMLGGHMTTVALRPYEDAPLTDQEGTALLMSVLERFETDNPTSALVAALPSETAQVRPQARPGGLRSGLQRLLQ